jgi:zinc transporter 1/2/3
MLATLTLTVIGITLVVAGDSFFVTLFIVILFHQMFEGIALGTCIAELPNTAATSLQKMIMAGVFALITPIGMAIGIGVLKKFNGNDPSTIVALGTLDALSAGILAWVGIVEMLARDWMHGRLLNANIVKTGIALFSLVAGMILMSVLGKWA